LRQSAPALGLHAVDLSAIAGLAVSRTQRPTDTLVRTATVFL
jgi:hypothetical protein